MTRRIFLPVGQVAVAMAVLLLGTGTRAIADSSTTAQPSPAKPELKTVPHTPVDSIKPAANSKADAAPVKPKSKLAPPEVPVKPEPPLVALRTGLVRLLHEPAAWYLGVEGGASNFNNLAQAECNLGLAENSLPAASCGQFSKAQVLKVFGGYHFNSLFGLEVGVTDLGSSKFSTSVTQISGLFQKSYTVPITGNMSSRAIDADLVVAMHPDRAGRSSVDVKAGAYSAFNTLTSTATGTHADARDNLAHTFVDNGSFFGVDANIRLFRNLRAQVEWNRFRNMGTQNQSSARDVDVVLGGFSYTF